MVVSTLVRDKEMFIGPKSDKLPAMVDKEVRKAVPVGAILGGVIGELQALLLIHLPHLLG